MAAVAEAVFELGRQLGAGLPVLGQVEHGVETKAVRPHRFGGDEAMQTAAGHQGLGVVGGAQRYQGADQGRAPVA